MYEFVYFKKYIYTFICDKQMPEKIIVISIILIKYPDNIPAITVMIVCFV